MSKPLEREIVAKLENATSQLLAATPAPDYATYLKWHARYLALQELRDFTIERNERLAAGELPDDE